MLVGGGQKEVVFLFLAGWEELKNKLYSFIKVNYNNKILYIIL